MTISFKKIIPAMLILVLCITQVFALSAAASQIDTSTYAIDLTVSFAREEGEKIETEAYQNCKFMIQNSLTKHYLIAQYNEADHCYVVSGSTVDKEAATEFSCGMDTQDPARLLISGMEAGRYWLVNIETAPEYKLLRDNVSICAFSNHAIVDTNTVDYEPDVSGTNRLPFTIQFVHGFALPGRRNPINLGIIGVSFIAVGLGMWAVLLIASKRDRAKSQPLQYEH